jgi:hypothetical protein
MKTGKHNTLERKITAKPITLSRNHKTDVRRRRGLAFQPSELAEELGPPSGCRCGSDGSHCRHG